MRIRFQIIIEKAQLRYSGPDRKKFGKKVENFVIFHGCIRENTSI